MISLCIIFFYKLTFGLSLKQILKNKRCRSTVNDDYSGLFFGIWEVKEQKLSWIVCALCIMFLAFQH